MLKRIGICIWILKRNIFKFHIVFVVISFFNSLRTLIHMIWQIQIRKQVLQLGTIYFIIG